MSIRAVHHLNCGTMCPLAGGLVGLGRMICHVLVVETERDGLILVDTGFGTPDVADPSRLPWAFRTMTGVRLDGAETAHALLTARGLRPDDVRHVVVTHLDLDHAGGLPDFPNAVVHVHGAELDAASARATSLERRRYLPAQWAHGPRWERYATDGETWRGLPAVRRLRGVDADVGLVALPGHTRGHSGVVVGGAHGRALVHAGDALFAAASLTGGKVPWALRTFERTMAIDDAARRGSLAALAGLHATGEVDVICAHDPSQLPA